MRILLVNHEYPPQGGGSGVATKHLAEALVRVGHEVFVLTTADEPRRDEEQGVCVQRFRITPPTGQLAGLRGWLSFLRRGPAALRKAVAEFNPDVINSQFLFPSGYVVARTKTTVPHVASTVGAEIHDPSRRFSADRNWIMRACVRRVVGHARVVTTSARDLTTRVRALYPHARDITEIPWPVPPVQPDSRSRHELQLRDDQFVITTLCRLVKRKRIDVLLRAIQMLSHADVYLVVMGSGPLEGELRRMASELGLASVVRFTGQVSEADKAGYLGRSDVFCLPSDHEGFGLVFVEAMSLGTPVISTNVGGQTDIIREGVDGFLVPLAGHAALAKRIETLRTDRFMLSKMSQTVPERAREFAPDVIARRFAEVYERARRTL